MRRTWALGMLVVCGCGGSGTGDESGSTAGEVTGASTVDPTGGGPTTGMAASTTGSASTEEPTTELTATSTTAESTGDPVQCPAAPPGPACDAAPPLTPPLFAGTPLGPTPFMVGDLHGVLLGTSEIVDFELDGDLDVVASTTAGVAVLLNDGTGVLTAPASMGGSCCATDVTLLRTAGDCVLDAVVQTGTAAEGNVAYHIQYGGADGFGSWTDVAVAGLQAPVDPIDLAGPFALDGEDPDDLLLMLGSSTYPLLGQDLGFNAGPAFDLELDLSQVPGLDLDGDGQAREAFCSSDVWEGACALDQNGVLLPEGVVATDTVFLGLARGRFADWDGDGDLDVIKQMTEVAGTGLWGFSVLDAATRLYDTGDPELFPGNAPIVADLNGDCRPDGFGYVSGANQLAISYADEMGGYSDPEVVDTVDTIRPIGAADMNGDGAVDIIGYYTGEKAVVVLLSGG